MAWIKPMEWDNEGTAPSDNLKSKGFQAGFRPPAPVFNHFLNKTKQCIEQLQEQVGDLSSLPTTDKSSVTNAMNELHYLIKLNADDIDALDGTVLHSFADVETEITKLNNDGADVLNMVLSNSKDIATNTSAIATLVGDDADKSVREIAKESALPIVNGASDDGITYTATVDNFELVVGTVISFVPERVSASTAVKLSINGSDAIQIYQSQSGNTHANLTPITANWLGAGKPILLKYNGTFWKTVEARTNVNELVGTIPLEKGGTGATNAEAARKMLLSTAPTATTSLSGAGYYYIYGALNNSHYNFGLVYWDGETTTYMSTPWGYYLIIQLNGSTGSLGFYTSSATVAGGTLYVTQIA